MKAWKEQVEYRWQHKAIGTQAKPLEETPRGLRETWAAWGKTVWDRAGYALALLPVLTDWVDTGHWPAHPRELATELVIGLIVLFGVHTLYRRADHFRSIAETDDLTGLWNRAKFRVDLDQAVRDNARTGRPLAVAFVDVDRFKEVNDRYGHSAGDALLQDVGFALARSVRCGVDRCYRLGGDEFALIVAQATPDQVMAALHRSFSRLSTRSGVPVSCSVGIALLSAGEDIGRLLERADQLMYSAKKGASQPVMDRTTSWGVVRNRSPEPALHLASL